MQLFVLVSMLQFIYVELTLISCLSQHLRPES